MLKNLKKWGVRMYKVIRYVDNVEVFSTICETEAQVGTEIRNARADVVGFLKSKGKEELRHGQQVSTQVVKM